MCDRPILTALRATCALSLVLATTAVAVVPAAAQEVRGRVLADADGAPLAGAYVVLLDAGGAVLARTVSTAGGTFSLRAPAPGRYAVRAEHIGFGTVEAPVAFEPGAAAVVELRAQVRAIELEGLVAEVDKECRMDPRVAARVLELWDEVGKAFRVTAFVEETGSYLMEVDRWRRRLDPERLLVEEEERVPRTGFHEGSPFVSLAADRLASEGYIQAGDEGGYRYYGPDVGVLLSEAFQDTHCFGFTDRPPGDGESGWVGIRFQPRERAAMDIEGTLWIEEATYAPQRLDFRYARLPYPLETDRVGGRIEFARIPQGPWIVRRWRIRTPLAHTYTVQLTSDAVSQRRYGLAAVLEDGGEVRRLKPFDSAEYVTLGQLGRVEGTVRETTGTPIAAARVVLEGTALRTRTDAEGRFAVDGVPEGRYTVTWTSPALDSLGLSGPTREVEVRAGEATAVDAVLPPAAVAVAERCTGSLVEDGGAVLRGTVEAAGGGGAPAGTRVHLEWEVVDRLEAHQWSRGVSSAAGGEPPGFGVVSPTAGWAVRVDGTTVTASVSVSGSGAWMACAVPDDEGLRVWAEAPGGERAGEPVDVTLRRGQIGELNLLLPAAPPGRE